MPGFGSGLRRRRRAATLACGALILLAGEVRAAAPDERKSPDVLYAEARAALDAGNYDKACPLFGEYYDRDPIPGALFALAECEARWGKPAKALIDFEEFIRRTVDTPQTPVLEQRTRIANDQINRLSQQVGKVTPTISPLVRGSVLVKLDGLPVAMPAAHPIVVEPGEHTIEILTEEGTHEQRRFIVGAGELRRIEVGGSPAEPPSPRSESGARSGDAPSRGGLSLPVLVNGGVGAIGLVVGGVFGILASSHVSDIDAHCAGTLCDSAGLRAADRAQTFATISTVAFSVGLVAVAATVVFYFVGPKPARSGIVTRSGMGASF